VSFGWQADGRIASVTDNNIPTMGPTSRTASFAYTADGRVQTGDGLWGNNSYAGACPRAGRRPDPGDAAGNLTQNGGMTMTVATSNNQITATSGSVVRALAYRAGGELTAETQTGDHVDTIPIP
jgi:hypothetical protein